MEGTWEEGDINKCQWGSSGGQLIDSAGFQDGNKRLSRKIRIEYEERSQVGEKLDEDAGKF